MRLQAVALLAGFLLLAPGVRAEEEYQNDNVVVVLDASGSMSGGLKGAGQSKMDAAKAALLEVLMRLPHTTKVGLLVFSGNDARFRDWVYPLAPPDYPKLRAAIMGPKPGGGTPLGQSMKMGADRLLQERQKQLGYGTYRLLAVTDGVADKPAEVDSYAKDIVARGITLDAIGVDMKSDHTLARLAHSYRRADDKASLQKAVTEIFAEISGKGAGAVADLAGDFELLAPLPAESAMAMIQALAASGNHPIGTAPPPPAPSPQPLAAAPVATQAPPSHGASPTAHGQVPAAATGGAAHGAGQAKEDGQKWLAMLGIMVFAFMMYGTMQQSKTPPRR